MKKILTIIGARPQFIKAAPMSNAIRKSSVLEEVIVHTGQHFDSNMSSIFFDQLGLKKPDYMLDINGLTHGAMTGRMMEEIEDIVLKEKPDFILVFGDTNSTLAGALVAKKLHVKLVHVEAGLRSFNMKMPEEINRIVTDRISDFLFCPTQLAIDNLVDEGFEKFNCIVEKVGDIMYDALRYFEKNASTESPIKEDYVLCTLHRAENTDFEAKLAGIISSLNEINKTVKVVMPLHPRTKNYIEKYNLILDFETIEPVGYLEMISLLKNAKLVLTDSGGLQKETYFSNKYCITIREETEWMELIDNKYNVIVGSNEDKIIKVFNELFYKKFPENKIELYGDGTCAEKIVKRLEVG